VCGKILLVIIARDFKRGAAAKEPVSKHTTANHGEHDERYYNRNYESTHDIRKLRPNG